MDVVEWLQTFAGDLSKYNIMLMGIKDINREVLDRISFVALSCSPLSDIPHSKTNKFTSVVENQVMLSNKGISFDTQYELKKMGESLQKRHEIIELILQPGEIYIVSMKYFEKDVHGKDNTWAVIAGSYAKRYNYNYIDRETIKRRHRIILQKLEKNLSL
jgi:hypothetical protein